MSLVSPSDSPLPAPRTAPTPPRRVETTVELEIELIRHLARSRRQGDQMALLWIEVELLSLVGQASADGLRETVAQALGARLLYRVRRTDFVFQVGDTGFAVLLDTDKAGAELVERRLFEQLRGPYGLEKNLAQVQISVGLAVSSEAHRHGSGLLQCAIDDIYARPQPAAAALPASSVANSI
ncbi:diguanylate cyclase domain-containing protein [Roseateles saccharophilus]|uniref:GGDEF domain-containing protein n=1 Tax=Roseateles saccharophilus TaxID=304 RepID=A0A4R3V855_ROSSA|nr:diguanylate cyclase [Roseateles saccharophilus]MDG0831522.1 diguanylate cyclase [Roseateles saccharophilus]TCU98594.1 GGDEF domain-containing protein [Roseateles saccharophilus]